MKTFLVSMRPERLLLIRTKERVSFKWSLFGHSGKCSAVVFTITLVLWCYNWPNKEVSFL